MTKIDFKNSLNSFFFKKKKNSLTTILPLREKEWDARRAQETKLSSNIFLL